MITDMFTWDIFIWFGISAVVLSATGAAVSKWRIPSIVLTMSAIVVMATFIIGLWAGLDRPPLRTMGETRLWYSFFALVAGLFTYVRWKFRWILPFSTVLATVFIVINILKPEIHDQTLVPALQSPWFIPHVIVYMFSYSFLGAAFLVAVAGLWKPEKDMMPVADTLVYIGTAFLTFGMLSGSLWAKDAWGQFWNWDPKETWALVTWLCYLAYIHLRLIGKTSRRLLCLLLIFSFCCLQMCWWGVNYLPAAQDSVHVY